MWGIFFCPPLTVTPYTMFGKGVFKNFLSWRLHKGGAFYTSSPDHPNYLHCSFQHPKGSSISKIPFVSPLQIFSVLIYSVQSGQLNLTSGSQLYVTVNVSPTRTASSVNFLSPLNLAAGIHEPAIYFMSAVGHSQLLGLPFSTKAGQVNPHLLTWQYGSKSKIIRLELLHCLRILFYL